MKLQALILTGILIAAALVYNTNPRTEYVEVKAPVEPPWVILTQWCDTPATALIIPQPGLPVAVPPDEIYLMREWTQASENSRVMFLEICYEKVKT